MQSPSVLHLPGPTGRPRQMVLRLDADTTIPLFEQLRAQISVMVAVGRLEPGSRLPTVRYMATQLNLAPGTIARTYRELERDGVELRQLGVGLDAAREALDRAFRELEDSEMGTGA